MDNRDKWVQLIQAGRRTEVPLHIQQRLAANVFMTAETAFHDLIIRERFPPIHVVSARGRNFIFDWFAGWRDFFGGEIKSSQRLLNKAVEEAQASLRLQAWRAGANIIVGYRIDTDELTGKGLSGFMVTLDGTPLQVEFLTPEVQRRNLGMGTSELPAP